jgi:hypothetical protein
VNTKVLTEFVNLEILSSELELEDSLNVNRLLALLFELELNIVLLHTFHRLARDLSCGLFKVSDVDRLRVTEEADDVCASYEDNALAFSFECLCICWKRSDVNCGVVLISANEICLLLSVFQQGPYLQVEDLLILFLSHGVKALVLVEETGRSGFNLALVNTPSFSELV